MCHVRSSVCCTKSASCTKNPAFQAHQLFTAAPAPLEVVLYAEAQVRNAIQQLKSAPAYTEVLKLEQAPKPKKDKKGKKS